MNGLDWTIVAVIVVSGTISIVRGFVKESVSLATWVLAFWIAAVFAHKLAVLLPPSLDGETVRWVVSAVALFMATLLVGGLTNFLLSTLVEKTGLSGTDRALGVVFGVLRGVVIVALLLQVGGATALHGEDLWQQSRLRGHFAPVSDWLRSHYPAEMAERALQ